MSDLSDDTIEHLARLSRISVTEADKKILYQDLNRIVDFIDLLEQVDTEGVATCDFVHKHHKHLLREDKVKDMLPRDEFLKNAPDHMGGMVKVPPIIKKE
ncbi:MAG: Glutamyl-tRNA(Gln) amidotransferase subunit C [Chlamydiae bacterium]|nr:Glutamyl-tRNA(Gln) amidotransferase subunit C [Chlamydiota bacterium]